MCIYVYTLINLNDLCRLSRGKKLYASVGIQPVFWIQIPKIRLLNGLRSSSPDSLVEPGEEQPADVRRGELRRWVDGLICNQTKIKVKLS